MVSRIRWTFKEWLELAAALVAVVGGLWVGGSWLINRADGLTLSLTVAIASFGAALWLIGLALLALNLKRRQKATQPDGSPSQAIRHMGEALVESDLWRPSAFKRNNGFYVLSSLVRTTKFETRLHSEGWLHFDRLAQDVVEQAAQSFDILVAHGTRSDVLIVYGHFETIVVALSTGHSAIEQLNSVTEGNRLRTDSDFQQNINGFNTFFERLMRDVHNIDLEVKLETGVAVQTA